MTVGEIREVSQPSARKGILSSYQKGDPAHGETTEN